MSVGSTRRRMARKAAGLPNSYKDKYLYTVSALLTIAANPQNWTKQEDFSTYAVDILKALNFIKEKPVENT